MSPDIKFVSFSVNGVTVASEATVGGVAPLIVRPEAVLTVQGTGFAPNAIVHVNGVTVGGAGDVAVAADTANWSSTKLHVYVPSVAELQTTNAHVALGPLKNLSYTYQRNAVFMPLAITVENPTSSSDPATSTAILGIAIPVPTVGEPRIAGRLVKIGSLAGDPEGTDDLGSPVRDTIGGEIRWYSPFQSTKEFSLDLGGLLPEPHDLLTYLVDAATDLTKTAPAWLATLRTAGKPLAAGWDDDGVSFEIPIDPQVGGSGVAVVWRDDLPSTPMLIDINPKITSISDHAVLGLPVVGGVAPVIVASEAKLTIRGIGFEAGATVNAVGVEVVGGHDGALRAGRATSNDNELCVYVPSMTELQTTNAQVKFGPQESLSYAYERNAIMLPLAIQVRNPDGTISTPVVLGLRLPPPTVGEPHITGRLVKIGDVETGLEDTDDLGAPVACDAAGNPIPNSVGGEIRLYGLSESTKLGSIDIASCLPANLLEGLWGDLAKIRTAGRFIKPIKGSWHDDSVSFEIPPEADFGMSLVVIWRDDLPSVPFPIWNLAFSCGDAEIVRDAIQTAVDDVWSFLPWAHNGESDPFALDTPFAPGDWVPFVLERTAAAVDNVVAHLLDTKDTGFEVRFWFDVSGHHHNNDPVTGSDTHWEPSVPTSSTDAVQNNGIFPFDIGPDQRTPLRMLVKPNLNSSDGDSTITVQLFASIRLPGQPSDCSIPYIHIGSAFTFRQKPIDIPTMAVFFTGVTCGHAPLFVLPKGQGIPGLPSDIFWDARGIFANSPLTTPPNPPVPLPPGGLPRESQTLVLARDRVLEALTLLKVVVDVLSYFPFPGGSWVDGLKGGILLLEGGAGFVIDTTGEVQDLGQRVYGGNDKFGRAIESVILIGTSKYKFHCSNVFVGQSGSELILNVPEGKYVAAFPDLSKLLLTMNLGGFELPLPDKSFAGPDLPAPAYWAHCMASIVVRDT